MNRTLKIFLAVCALLLSAGMKAASPEDEAAGADSRRPKVGVVLSGGGAKGVAHIGVLKMLEEMDVPVDLIVGTSAGSIVGGFYALGYNASEIDSLLRHQDWDMLVQDKVHRRDRLYEDKMEADRLTVRIPFKNSIAFGEDARKAGKRVRKPLLDNIASGLIEGHNVNQLFTAVSVGYQDSVDFNDLPIPFACVAIDLNSKQEVVFHSGNIVEAIRASMAIPGVFSPVIKDGMYLVDGGMSNNFPVDVAREMGADIVIGVDLHAYDKAMVKPVGNVGDLLGNLLVLMNNRKYYQGRSEADILICPNTGSFGVLSFSDEVFSALVDSGYVAAGRNAGALSALAAVQREAGYDGRRFSGGPKAINIKGDSVFVSRISVSGADPDQVLPILEDSGITVGAMVNGDDIEDIVDGFYRTKAFSKVIYSLAGRDSGYNLKLHFTPEKLHEVGLSFRFDSEEMASILLYLSINRHKLSGWKASFLGRLANSPYLSLAGSYAFNHNWQLNLNGTISKTDANIYIRDIKAVNADINYQSAELNVQNKGDNYELLLGARAYRAVYGSIMLNEGFFTALERGYNWNAVSAFGSFGFDNRDKAYFPTRGVAFGLKADVPLRYGEKGLMQTGPYLDSYLEIQGVIPVGKRFVVIPQLYSRLIFISPEKGSHMVSVSNATFGGYETQKNLMTHLPFAGLNHTYFADRFTAVGRVDLRYNVFRSHYVTAMGNVLFSAPQLQDMFSTGRVLGFAVGYSINTLIGPVGLNLQWSDLTGKVGAYFSLGYSF